MAKHKALRKIKHNLRMYNLALSLDDNHPYIPIFSQKFATGIKQLAFHKKVKPNV